MKGKKNSRGFSMIELIVVLSISALLAYVGFTNYTTQVRKARDSRRKSDLEAIKSALEIYKADNDQYPTAGNLGDLDPNYIAVVPEDPVNSGSHVYTYAPVCSTSTTVCSVTRDCTGAGNCCAYELSVVLEYDGSTYQNCSP